MPKLFANNPRQLDLIAEAKEPSLALSPDPGRPATRSVR